jgi:D-alanyl-D-alanine carboxypeptidase
MLRPLPPKAVPGLLLLALVLSGCRGPLNAQDCYAAVDAFVERTDFNGVVLIARGDSVLHAEGYGFEDVEAGLPTRVDTRYEIGSVAKWITALVALHLVDEGALSPTAPVASLLPGYRADTGRRVTLHHLLTNTSGIPDDLRAAYEADPAVLDEPMPTAEAVRRFASGDLQFAPGSRFEYALSNWILVQAIIEQATGQPFEAVVRERVTQPLGLDDTGVFWDGGPVPHLAPGYEDLDPPERSDLPAPKYLASAGGIYSTAPDLLALLDAVYGGRLLSEASLQRLDTVYWEDGDLSAGGRAGGYAYGGRVRAMELGRGPEPVLWHTGSNGPSKVRMSRVLADGPTVLTLTNADTSHEATGHFIERALKAECR